MAGQELSYLASEHQDRIAGLVYLDAAYRYAYDVPGEFEKDFPSLPSPPPTLPAVARPPFTLPEAERRQPRGETTAREAIPAGGRQFTKIGLPALAIFASPHDTGAATADPEFDRFDEALTERQARAFERGVPGARVLRWPRASHYLFLTRPSDVIKEVTSFWLDCAEPVQLVERATAPARAAQASSRGLRRGRLASCAPSPSHPPPAALDLVQAALSSRRRRPPHRVR